MKITLLQILIVLAVLALLATLVLPALLQRDRNKSHYSKRFYVRPLSFFERMALPFVRALDSLATRANRIWHGGNRLVLANAVLTPPLCSDTAKADAAIGRYKLVKFGSDEDHIALCGANDIPLGFTRDASASVAEERLAYDHLGLSTKGTEGTASGAIIAGSLICPGANGSLRDITILNGETVYICGRAKTSAADGEQFAWVPYGPVQRIIA